MNNKNRESVKYAIEQCALRRNPPRKTPMRLFYESFVIGVCASNRQTKKQISLSLSRLGWAPIEYVSVCCFSCTSNTRIIYSLLRFRVRDALSASVDDSGGDGE